jgi:putative Flp pilus-assembly TadE/G-like protein
MLTRLRHIRRDERGMSMVYVGMGFMAFLSATTLAIDVGMFMTARTQAQTSADSGALAGAVALFFNDFNDRSPSGPAVQSAMHTAQSNQVIDTTVSVTPADVTFPLDPSGQPNRVKVDVYRTGARGNPVPTLMGSLFGVQNADIVATATAEVSPANAMKCVLPFTIPDRWREASTGQLSQPTDTYDPSQGDVYVPPDDGTYMTGYNAARDKGMQITLKANNTSKVTASFYNPWDLPGSVGASDYRNNIDTCNPASITWNHTEYPPETGNMVGPTKQGTDDLVAQDPGAYWDTSCNCIQGSKYANPLDSPRVAKIPVYDPQVFLDGPAHGKNIDLSFVNMIGFFIEPLTGPGEVTGRIIPVTGIWDKNAGPAPPGSFPKVLMLVQ